MKYEQEKGNYDEEMTGWEIKILINAIVRILKDNGVDEDVIKKIEDLAK